MRIPLFAPRLTRGSRASRATVAARAVVALACAAPAGAQPAADRATHARLAHVSDSAAAAGPFSGVVLVARDGVPLFERAYGFADRETRRPNDVATSFNVSSIGKLFTQVAVQQLASAGKLDLDATLGRYLPDYANADAARRVTIRQMLAHTSGIGGDIFQAGRFAALRHNRDYLPLFAADSLHFAPGTKREYSNAAYVVLGAVVERVSGEEFSAYVRRHVLAPAGMTHSGYYATDSLPAFAALGYTRGSGGDTTAPLRPNAPLQPRAGSAAGGVYASAADLLRFVAALRAGALGVADADPHRLVMGGSPGSNGAVAEGVADRYDVIVLANLDPPAAGQLADVLTALFDPGGSAARRRGPRVLIAAGGAPTPLADRMGAATAPATFPDTPAGHALAAYVRAFNSGSVDSVRAFTEAHVVPDPARPMAERLARYRSTYDEFGPLTLAAVGPSTPDTLTASMTAARGGSVELRVEVEPDGAHRVRAVMFDVRTDAR